MQGLRQSLRPGEQLLEERSKDLGKFANYVKMYHAAQDERPEMEDLMLEVEQLYSLIRKYQVRMPSDDEVVYEGLKAEESDFTKKT